MEKHAKKLMKSAKSNLAKAKRSYTCRSLKDLVRAYRACTTAAEERALVKKESAHIRDLFREGDKAFRRQNIAKLLFFHMNGYPTSFGMTECIKLCASPKYADKRVAYLGLMILVDETADILMLMTNCLKQDLQSTDRSIASLALSVLADVASADMVRDLLPEICIHLAAQDPHLRKKALLASVRAVRKLERVELDDLFSALPNTLETSSAAVLCCGAALVSELAKRYPADKQTLANVAFAPLAAGLRQLLLTPARGNDTTVSGVRSPFLTVKLLAALRSIAGPPQADALAQLVSQVATNTAHTHVIGCAVLYECVRCALAVPADEGLRTQTVEILGRFLAHKLASVRYVALQELVKVCALPDVGTHVAAYRDTILACLAESDPTVSQMAVELVYAIATPNDSVEMCSHLLKYLDGEHAAHHQQETCHKLFDLATRFGDDPDFLVNTFVAALVKVDLHMPEELVTAFASYISRTPAAQRSAVRVLYNAALVDRTQRRKPRLERVAVYIVGEYGDLVTGEPDGIHAHAIVDALEAALADSPVQEPSWINTQSPEHLSEVARIRETALSALAKFATRHEGGGSAPANGGGAMDGLAALALMPGTTPDNALALVAQPAAAPAPAALTGLAGDALAGLGLDDKALTVVPNVAETATTNALVPTATGADTDVLSRVRNSMLHFAASSDLETQQRACEYAALLAPGAEQLRAAALARFPPVDYDDIQRRAAKRREDALRESSPSLSPIDHGDLLALTDAPAAAPTSRPKTTADDLDGLLGLPAPTAPAPATNGNDLSGLNGLLGLPAPAAAPPPQGAPSTLEQLMASTKPTVTAAAAPPVGRTAVDILNSHSNTLGGDAMAVAAEPNEVGSLQWEPTADVIGALQFLRDGPDRTVTRVRATFTNKTATALRGFNFALAVPNGMTVRMEAVSSDVLGVKPATIMQDSIVSNPMHGSKPLRLMYKVAYHGSAGAVEMTGKLKPALRE